MKIEMLHAFSGDKEKDIDTSTPEARLEAKKAIETLQKQGITLFLESGENAYIVKGYDPESDEFMVLMPKKDAKLAVSGAKPHKNRSKQSKIGLKGKRHLTGVAPRAGG